jgi:hypothetical protein
MGVAYDCFWYWRHEFNGQADPYAEQNNAMGDSNTSSVNNIATDHVLSSTHVSGSDTTVLTDQIFPDDINEGDFFPSWEWPSNHAFI